MADIEKTIENILSRMTLAEKIGQLNQQETPVGGDVEAFKAQIRRGEIGSVLMSVGATAGNDEQGEINIDFYNELQRVAVEESRSGVPILFCRDVIHGHRTVFPIPLALAASFDEVLIEKSYSDIADEASDDGVHLTFAPMIDLSRDPRWGRVIEGAGEDPYLGGRVAAAVVNGVQGDGKMLACAKHFIGYGASEGGRDYHRAEISDYTLNNYYLPAFRSAVDAGVATVMSSFNDVSGQPVTSSRYYLTEILRDRLGFDGAVISDYDAVEQLIRQGVAESDADCAELAVLAGLDIDMHDKVYLAKLEKLVENGKISTDVIDAAVRRVLKLKLEKGLFEKPYCEKRGFDLEKHRADAKDAAAESAVLLKNDGVLPLDKDAKISLVGPFVTERRSHLGSWMLDGKAEETPNMLEAMTKISRGEIFVGEFSDKSDIIVLCLGESWKMTGENRSVADITLSGEQKELIKQAKATGKKVVGVLFCGRPIPMGDIEGDLDAILLAWHGGSEAAVAVSELLYGDRAPSGKLPMTVLRRTEHIPMYYNVTSSGRPTNCYYGENAEKCYRDGRSDPCFPFGYGLSYTKFAYGNIICGERSLSLDDLRRGKEFTVSVTVENIGDRDGKEVVELYIHDKVAKMMRPLRELKAFRKILVKKGEKNVVSFDLGYHDLGYYLASGEYTLEAGEFEIFVGGDCLTDRHIVINVI